MGATQILKSLFRIRPKKAPDVKARLFGMIHRVPTGGKVSPTLEHIRDILDRYVISEREAAWFEREIERESARATAGGNHDDQEG